ncbi:MAG: hypothetical protein HZC28_12055 [Spirochaetes bacterium]|nr:hypothetical protein [Spirochaetota bacterium]
MCKIFPPSLFFGMLLIVGGILVIIKNFTHIRIPIFSVLFALFLIWLGVCLLVKPKDSVFARTITADRVSATLHNERIDMNGKDITNKAYDVSFGQLIVDMKNATVAKGSTAVTMSVSFGNLEVYIDKAKPLKITGSVSFGNLDIFEKQTSGLDGSIVYETPSYKDAKNKIEMRVDCSFGNVRIRE